MCYVDAWLLPAPDEQTIRRFAMIVAAVLGDYGQTMVLIDWLYAEVGSVIFKPG